ncbi:dihydrolipoyl dehydrogenase family protein [Mycobacterium sp. WMMD1722]|uniref:dihydrolipoyl dehydrogenase family protein n=1 Tax=Mycobacterium sp. WMMD1722 TaxID=3404117 RepID=UPI003BF523E4
MSAHRQLLHPEARQSNATSLLPYDRAEPPTWRSPFRRVTHVARRGTHLRRTTPRGEAPQRAVPARSKGNTVVMSRQFDAVVIGGGPGGATAAFGLARRGLSVCVVEDRLVGGECHYWACNPTKSLIRPIEVLALAKAVPGVREVVSGDRVNVDAVLAKRDAVIDHLADHDVVANMRAAGIEVIHGHGRLDGERSVVVGGTNESDQKVRARHAVVLATGTRPVIPDVPGLLTAAPWTNRDLAVMSSVPSRAIVVGGGVVGVECATILSGLGSAVTLLVRGPRLLRGFEPFAGERVMQALQSRGVTIHHDLELTSVSRDEAGGGVWVRAGDLDVEADEIVLATGRTPNTDDLGVDSVGLTTGEFVSVDDNLTALGVDGDWLYAIGDTTGRALLSHVSQYHAGIVARVVECRARGKALRGAQFVARDRGHIPQVVFTDPQVVQVGYTEAEAVSAGLRPVTRSARYSDEIAELAILRDGFDAEAKLVIDAAGDTLLGVTLVGPDVGDLVHAATTAIVGKVPLSVLQHVIAPHPSLSQMWNPLVAAPLDE